MFTSGSSQQGLHFILLCSLRYDWHTKKLYTLNVYILMTWDKYSPVFSFFNHLNHFSIILYWLWYYSSPNFPPFAPFHHTSSTPSGNPPNHCSHPWIMQVSSLAPPFPILYFTSPWLFCNYLLVCLNPLTSWPIPPRPPPMWQPSKHSLYPWFSLCSSCLLRLFLRFNFWYISIYCYFIVYNFDLLFLIWLPLTFHIIMVWWWWTPLVFFLSGKLFIALWF